MNASAILDQRVKAAENDILTVRKDIIDALQSHVAIRARTIVIDDAQLAQDLDDRLKEAKDALADVIERRKTADEIMAQIRQHDIEALHQKVRWLQAILETGISHVWEQQTNRPRPTGTPITKQERKSSQAELEAKQAELAEIESLQAELESLV